MFEDHANVARGTMRPSFASGDGMTHGPPEAQSAKQRFGCRVLRSVLWVLLIASGLVLAARAIGGPFRLGVSVISPMNAESWFSFAALGLLLTNAVLMNTAPLQTGVSARGRRSGAVFAAAVIALAVGAAFGWICRFPFIADDYDH